MQEAVTAAPEVKSGDAEISRAFEEFMRSFEAFKETNDLRLGDIERRLSADVLTEEKMARIDTALDEQKRALDQLVLKSRRPALGGDNGRAALPSEHKAAFDAYVRSGEEANLRRVEQKALSVGTPADGGYLVPDETEREIGRRLAQVSPIRGIASVRQISGNVYKKPFVTAGAVSGWAGETD